MSTATTDLLLHPVRMRIVNALSRGRSLTTAELVDRLREFGQATVYRHVARLFRADVLQVDGEVRIRGVVERRYRLRPDRARISPSDAAAMPTEAHRRAFTAAMAAILAEFNDYLDQRGANPHRDRAGYRTFVLWLDPTEHEELIAEVGKSLARRMGNGPRPGRTPYRMSPIHFPLERPSARGKRGPSGRGERPTRRPGAQ